MKLFMEVGDFKWQKDFLTKESVAYYDMPWELKKEYDKKLDDFAKKAEIISKNYEKDGRKT